MVRRQREANAVFIFLTALLSGENSWITVKDVYILPSEKIFDRVIRDARIQSYEVQRVFFI